MIEELKKLVKTWRAKAASSRESAKYCLENSDYDGYNSFSAFAGARNSCADDVDALIARHEEDPNV